MKKMKSFYRTHMKVVACVLLLGSFSILAQTLQPTAKPKAQVIAGRINVSNVAVSQPSGAAITESEPGAQNSGPTPGPLSQSERAAVAAQLKSLTAPSPSSLVSTANIPPAPPSQFVLTPEQPRSGDSWMTVAKGYSFPGGSQGSIPPHATIKPGDSFSSVILHFNPLSSGRTYMLDCTVAVRVNMNTVSQDSGPWKFEGEISGNIAPQSGHLLAGFVAVGAVSEIKIRPPSSGNMWGYVYRCELTKVN